MKKYLLFAAAFWLFVSCEKELDYNLDSVEPQYVLNAMWYAGDSQHDVFLCTSNAFNVTPPQQTARVSCYVNGILVCETSHYTLEKTLNNISLHKYTLTANLHEGDQVEIVAKYPGHELHGTSSVPKAPHVQLDTTSVSRNTYDDQGRLIQEKRLYHIDLSLADEPGTDNYYRLISPFLRTEVRINHECLDVQEWPWLPFNEDDPVFKNLNVQFPKELLLEFPFLGGASNSTHVFSDELFKDKSYQFHFEIDQKDYMSNPWNERYSETTVRFRLFAIPWKEYTYLIATNAAMTSFYNPMAEPVTIPYNIEGGLGFFSVDNGFDRTITLKRCHYYNYMYETYNTSFRKGPVTEAGSRASSSGVPSATMRPPLRPPEGPMSKT